MDEKESADSWDNCGNLPCHSVVSKGQGFAKITVRRSWHTVRHIYVIATLSAKAKNNRGDLDQER